MSLPCLCLLAGWSLPAQAQVGEHRNDFQLGFSGGYVMSSVGFTPKVPQGQKGGGIVGVTARYTSEKYFNSICAIVGEVNMIRAGWKENILNIEDQPVINQETSLPEEYAREMTYLQIPIFARLGWGRERRGVQFFFQIGPQLEYMLSEGTNANFDIDNPNINERVSHVSGPPVEGYNFSNMYHMPVENKFDYGIAGGGGIEFSHPRLGHFMLEGRYYYGLGDIYGNSKRDYFARSNLTYIVVKLSYLFDLVRTKNAAIK